MKALIELRNVCRSFQSERGGEVRVLKGINLSIEPGTFNVIRGESGSGKTTLLKILGLLDAGFDGEFSFQGMAMTDRADWWLDEVRASNIGFIFQDGQLFEHMSLRQNIELPLLIQGGARGGITPRQLVDAVAPSFFKSEELNPQLTGDEALAQQGSLLDAQPKRASGGQRQRAAVMRSIIHEPCLILADEPTASLDHSRKFQVLKLLQELSKAGHTVIVVTHDQLFYDSGRQLEMRDGLLVDHGYGGTEPATAPAARLPVHKPAPGSRIGWGWLPRSSSKVLLRQALRETFQRWLFLLLILSALIAGVTQISVFSSVITGAETIVDKAFTSGSRLNRVEIRPKRADLRKKIRFPNTDDIKTWKSVQYVVPRRQTLVRMTNIRKEEITYVAMGLHDDDPEYKLLDFLGGGPFTRGVDQLEIIVTATLLPDFFDTSGLGDGTVRYDDFIGRKLTLLAPRFSPDGKRLKQVPVKMNIIGIILNAEGGRQIYLPNRTQVIFDRVIADKQGVLTLPVSESGDAWTLDAAARLKFSDVPWEDKLQVYTTGVRDVLPVIRKLADTGYRPKSDIWKFKWALDIQDIAWRIFTPLLILIIVAVTLTVAANIFTSAKLREREFALWRVLGMRRGDLAFLQVVAAILAILLGSLIGLGVAWVVVDQSRSFLLLQYPKDGFGQIFAPVAQFFLPILLGALVVGILAAIIPAIRAARVDPAKVLQS